jgi:hypothetical protein
MTCCQNTTDPDGVGLGPELTIAASAGRQAPATVGLDRCDPPRVVASPRLDGHTRARWSFAPTTLTTTEPKSAVHAEFVELVAELRRPRTKSDDRREKRSGLLVRRLPTGEHCECTVSGVRRQLITLHVWDVVHVTLNAETGDLRLQWKARALWSTSDQLAVIGEWVERVSSWCGVELVLGESFAAGWTVTGVELCADFVGLTWRREDAAAFLGRYTRGSRDQVRTRAGDDLSVFTDLDDKVQTINIGSRKSNVSWCLYDKTGQIDRAKDGSNLPTYSSTWQAHGWNGTDEVARVELRLTSRGLTFETADGEELNLRDPAELTSSNLHRAWAHCCSKYRLVELGTATRRERCSIDERWSSVQRAVDVDVEQLVQHRAVAADAHGEKVRRSAKSVARGMRRLAALHGARVATVDGLGLLARLADTYAAVEVDLEAYGEAYAKLVDATLAPEIEEARQSLSRVLGASVQLDQLIEPLGLYDADGVVLVDE